MLLSLLSIYYFKNCFKRTRKIIAPGLHDDRRQTVPERGSLADRSCYLLFCFKLLLLFFVLFQSVIQAFRAFKEGVWKAASKVLWQSKFPRFLRIYKLCLVALTLLQVRNKNVIDFILIIKRSKIVQSLQLNSSKESRETCPPSKTQ